eukprot:3301823-Rhodomonas_salina.1
MSGTEIAFAGSRCAVLTCPMVLQQWVLLTMECPVLSERMALSAYVLAMECPLLTYPMLLQEWVRLSCALLAQTQQVLPYAPTVGSNALSGTELSYAATGGSYGLSGTELSYARTLGSYALS